MPQHGLGNYQYTVEVSDGNAIFKFYDAEDASNTAEVTIHQNDFPEGAPGADDRRVADLAYAQVSEKLNEKRNARLVKAQNDQIAAKAEQDKRERAAAQDFFDNSQDVATAPVKVEKDGTRVYNIADPQSRSQSSKPDKKK